MHGYQSNKKIAPILGNTGPEMYWIFSTKNTSPLQESTLNNAILQHCGEYLAEY